MIVDSGVKIDSVDRLLNSLDIYIQVIPNFKIGNVVEIHPNNGSFELKLKYQSLTKPI